MASVMGGTYQVIVAVCGLMGNIILAETGASPSAFRLVATETRTTPASYYTKLLLVIERNSGREEQLASVELAGRHYSALWGIDTDTIARELIPPVTSTEPRSRVFTRGNGGTEIEWVRIQRLTGIPQRYLITAVLSHAPLTIPVRLTDTNRGSIAAEVSPVRPSTRLTRLILLPDESVGYVYAEVQPARDIDSLRVTVNQLPVPVIRLLKTQAPHASPMKVCAIVSLAKIPLQAAGATAAVSVRLDAEAEVVGLTVPGGAFPIGEWRASETRPSMFFDDSDALASPSSSPQGWMCAGRDVQFRNNGDWRMTAREILDATADTPTRKNEAGASWINLANPCDEDAFIFFAHLTSHLLANPYLTRGYGPTANGDLLASRRPLVDPQPITAIAEAFQLDTPKANHAWRRALGADELETAVLREIAAGSAGVRYYSRSLASGRGYADDTACNAAVARVNLRLQLLKEFLRIADTAPVSRTTNPQVRAETLLAGDSGAVVFLFHDPPAERAGKYRSLLDFSDDFTLSCMLPACAQVVGVYGVDAGMVPLPYTVEGAQVLIPCAGIASAQVLLIDFAKAAVAHAPPPQKDNEAGFSAWVAQRTAPLRRESLGTGYSCAAGVEIAARATQIRAVALARLAQMGNDSPDWPALRDDLTILMGSPCGHRQMSTVAALAQALEAITPAQRHIATMKVSDRLAEIGHERLGAASCLAVADSQNMETAQRYRLIDHARHIFEDTLLDYGRASDCVRQMIPLGTPDARPLLYARLAWLELMRGNGAKAETILSSLPGSATDQCPTDLYRALASAQTGAHSAAISHAEKAVSSSPAARRDALIALQQLSAVCAQYDKAAAYSRQIAAEFPGDAAAPRRAAAASTIVRPPLPAASRRSNDAHGSPIASPP